MNVGQAVPKATPEQPVLCSELALNRVPVVPAPWGVTEQRRFAYAE